jgi:putrescine transport system substrate-binding protein
VTTRRLYIDGLFSHKDSMRIAWVLILAGLVALAATSCGGSGGGRGEDAADVVNVYNWSDYIGPDTLERFERETGIRVNYDTYDSSEIVDAKLLAGNTGYDVVVHSGQFSARLIPIGIYQPLDRSKLPNWKHLDPKILKQVDGYPQANEYSAVYMWGTTGFAYNVDMVRQRMPDAPVASARMLFDPEVVRRFADCGVTLLDSPTDVFPMVLAYLGLPPGSLDADHLAAAEAQLMEVRPYIRYFSSTKMISDLPNREVCIAMSWSGDYAQAAARAAETGAPVDLEYTVPQEGTMLWYDGLYIPADAPHRDNAYRFINFLLRPDVIAEISNYVYYANGNLSSVPLLDPAVINDPGIYPDEAIWERAHLAPVSPPKMERLRTRAWARVKSGI